MRSARGCWGCSRARRAGVAQAVCAELAGEEVAQDIRLAIEYAPQPPAAVLNRAREQRALYYPERKAAMQAACARASALRG